MTEIRERINLPPSAGIEIKQGLKLRFCRHVLLDKSLKPGDFRVAFYLTDMCMYGRDYSWPGTAAIAKMTGLSERTVKDAKDRLAKSKWFYIHSHNDGTTSDEFLPAWERALARLPGERDDCIAPAATIAGDQRQPLPVTGADIASPPVQALHPGGAEFAPKTPDSNPLVETSKETQIPAAAAKDDSDVGIDGHFKSPPQPVNDNHAYPVGGFDQFNERWGAENLRAKPRARRTVAI